MKTVEELRQDLIEAGIAFREYFEPVMEENTDWFVSIHDHYPEVRISVWRRSSEVGHHGAAMITSDGVITVRGEYTEADLQPIIKSLEKLK